MTLTIKISWSEEDNVWLANIPELDATTHGHTINEAILMVAQVVELCMELP